MVRRSNRISEDDSHKVFVGDLMFMTKPPGELLKHGAREARDLRKQAVLGLFAAQNPLLVRSWNDKLHEAGTRSFCFVTFATQEQVQQALAALATPTARVEAVTSLARTLPPWAVPNAALVVRSATR